MAHGSLLATVVAVAAAISLSASAGAAVEPTLTLPGVAPPTPQAETLSDENVRSELRRLNTMKMECATQARQALAAQQTASGAGRTSEAEAQGQILWTRLTCVERANQALLRLRDQVTREQLRLFRVEDGFHQEYRQGLQSHLSTLERLSKQLADQNTHDAETFAKQMDTFRRQREAFRNRYIRLLNDAETQELTTTLFQAGNLLIGSAQVWKQQVKADAEIAELSPKGPSPELSRAQAARDTAVTERARQWEMAQRLIIQATALTATR